MRGGLLRHGSILTVTSYATRTSPVIRGKWILDNILGMPPPPPPPAVPALKENTGSRQEPSDARAARASIAPIPPAPAATTSWIRSASRSRITTPSAAGERSRTTTPIDAAGGLPDGSKFEGVAGLEQALLSRPELFVDHVYRKASYLRLGPGSRVLRCPGGPQDRAGGAGQGFPLLVVHPGDRQQHTVSDEEITMIITKKALPRRTFLRGMGATLALPLLDAMVPSMTALAATPANPVRRLGFVYMPMGAQHRPVDSSGRGQPQPSFRPLSARWRRLWISSPCSPTWS